EAEAEFVVGIPFLIVEIPGAARLAAQEADPVGLAAAKPPHPAGGRVRLPLGCIQAPFIVQRGQNVVAVVALALGMTFLAREFHVDVSDRSWQGHMEILLCLSSS